MAFLIIVIAVVTFIVFLILRRRGAQGISPQGNQPDYKQRNDLGDNQVASYSNNSENMYGNDWGKKR